MVISEIRVFPVHEERLKAYVTITIDGCFVVRDLKIIHGNNGLFVAMPSKKRKDGTFKDIAHPLNTETREKMENQILDEFDKEMQKSGMAPIPRNAPPPGYTPGAPGRRDEAGNPEDDYQDDAGYR